MWRRIAKWFGVAVIVVVLVEAAGVASTRDGWPAFIKRSRRANRFSINPPTIESTRGQGTPMPITRRHIDTRGRLYGGWGSTIDEQTAELPGDHIIERPHAQITHAISLDSPPEDVWPWLAQMGYGRGGWYTPTFVDTLWRVRNPSADEIVPDLQNITTGQIILDGPPGTAVFTVIEADAPLVLALHSQRHPITGRPPDTTAANPGPYLDFSWVFVAKRALDCRTRLLLRTRSRAHPAWLRTASLLLVPVDLFMGRSMLKGIKSRVDAHGLAPAAAMP